MSRAALEDRRTLVGRLRGIVARRELLHAFTKREVQVRYKQAFLGMAWAVFMPFALMLIFTLLRQGMVAPGLDEEFPYAVWAYAGLLPWTLHQVALKGCTNTLVTNKNLLAKVYFPREVFPLAKIGAALVDFAVGSTVLFGLMWYFEVDFTSSMLLLPVVVLVHVIQLAGFGFLLSSANLFFRDVQYVFDVLIIVWMFASPVFLDPAGRWFVGGVDVLKFGNPMHAVLTGYRDVLLGGGLQDPAYFLYGVEVSLLIFVLGYLVFICNEPKFAERV